MLSSKCREMLLTELLKCYYQYMSVLYKKNVCRLLHSTMLELPDRLQTLELPGT